MIEPHDLDLLLRTLHGYQGSFLVSCAMRLGSLVFTRPGELRMAQWADIDLANGLWEFSSSKTKTPYIAPLPSRAIVILVELRPLTGVVFTFYLYLLRWGRTVTTPLRKRQNCVIGQPLKSQSGNALHPGAGNSRIRGESRDIGMLTVKNYFKWKKPTPKSAAKTP